MYSVRFYFQLPSIWLASTSEISCPVEFVTCSGHRDSAPCRVRRIHAWHQMPRSPHPGHTKAFHHRQYPLGPARPCVLSFCSNQLICQCACLITVCVCSGRFIQKRCLLDCWNAALGACQPCSKVFHTIPATPRALDSLCSHLYCVVQFGHVLLTCSR